MSNDLKKRQHTGAAYADTYTIFPGNSFGIPVYPEEKTYPYLGDGKVRVLWFYLISTKNGKRSWKKIPTRRSGLAE